MNTANPQKPASAQSTRTRFTAYVDVVNRAIAKNRGGPLVKTWDKIASKLLADKTLDVGVYSDDADRPHTWFALHYRDSRFVIADQSAQPGKGEDEVTWKLPEHHMDTVIADPQTYIEHPTKIDMNWIKERM